MKKQERQGRVIRSYRHDIPREDFEAWSAIHGAGLYALYRNKKLMYVGLATKNIKSRIHAHERAGNKAFTHFSIFRVVGKDCDARKRRIRDLEALLLKLIKPTPKWNKNVTRFIHARKQRKPKSKG